MWCTCQLLKPSPAVSGSSHSQAGCTQRKGRALGDKVVLILPRACLKAALGDSQAESGIKGVFLPGNGSMNTRKREPGMWWYGSAPSPFPPPWFQCSFPGEVFSRGCWAAQLPPPQVQQLALEELILHPPDQAGQDSAAGVCNFCRCCQSVCTEGIVHVMLQPVPVGRSGHVLRRGGEDLAT